MLKIRLQRTGRENVPTYRIVVAEKSDPVKGKIQEIVGHYLPARDPAVFEFNEERIAFWVSRGAMPSETLARLLRRAGMKGMEKFITRYTKQKPKKEVVEAPAAAAPKTGDSEPKAA